ncbi:kinase-like domain-containing protein [Rhizophagus irregularis DAOM 181602=DAOM 197198]|nr:kinase-like domain-containing protein [Rhizophagus irregularis DAOM 181602=DAOM 197198]
MSTTKEQTNDSEYVDWIKKEIENNNITYFNHNEFTNKQEFENSISSVGKIFKVNWSNNDNTRLIVKTPGLNVKKIINELKIRKEIDSHINILRIYGISKLDNKYSLVLEYADGGSLYSYLKKNFTKLEWNDKYRLALQLASAVEYIHDKGIIHCNLHAHNVLIHKGHIKVADFGLSKKATETSNYSDDVLGTIPYIDPKYLSNVCDIQYGSKLYTLNFKSDIYSIGALFLLLSSGRRPFYDDESIKYDANLAMDIMMGKREKIIGGTPAKYSDLYTACWKNDPNERPSIQQVVLCLKSMIKQDINEEKNSTKFIKNVIEKEPSNEDFDNMMDNDYNFFIGDDFSNSLIDDDFDLNMNDIIQKNLLIDITDSDDVGKIIDKLIDHLIKLHDELGYGFAGAKQIIEQNIKYINQPLDDILDWLNDNQISSKYIFFHGFLYFNGIIVKGDEDKAFASFSKASKDNYSMAQVYLCKWYENNEKDDLKAFECYEKAAKSGNKIAQLNLGYFYDHGKGTQRNKDKAIEWYEKSAKQECSNAQLFLGILYKGTKKDFKNAFYWVEKATKNGNRIAQFYLGKYYYFGTGVKKDYGKSFEWYEKSAKQGYIDALYALGYLYLKGKGTEKNLEKAHYLIEKAAENGNKFAQHHLAEKGYLNGIYNLGYCYENGIGAEIDKEKAVELYEDAAKRGNRDAQKRLKMINS